MTDEAWFTRNGAVFSPRPLARSLWSDNQIHGVAVAGLLAKAMEETAVGLGRAELVPARFHVDLFRAARMVDSTATATVVREGPRLLLLDAVFEQGERRVARASAIFLQPTENPTGLVWSAEPADRPAPPEPEVLPFDDDDHHHVPFFASDKPWSNNFTEHQNAGRHAMWNTAMPIVYGEAITPFQAVASIADNTSMVTNWGSGGVEYINTDISLALTRRPAGVAIGVRSLDHLAADGIAVGCAEVFDRAGMLGIVTVSCLANTRRTVDFTQSEYDGTVTV